MSYLLSLGLGLLVGVAYALIGVRSPAPPIVALVGLLGMLAGEQGTLMVRHALTPVATPLATPERGTCGTIPAPSCTPSPPATPRAEDF